MRTQQKKVKFTKGMVTKELLERSDLPMYDSSAQLIENYICSVYGSLKTRVGTKYIDVFEFLTEEFTGGNQIDGSFISNSINSYNVGDVLVEYDLVEVKSSVDIVFDTAKVNYREPNLVAKFTPINEYNTRSVIGAVDIIDGGEGFNGSLSVSVAADTGETLLTPVVDDLGVVSNVIIASGEYRYVPQDTKLSVSGFNKVVVGVSVSKDGTSWSDEVLFNITNDQMKLVTKGENIKKMRVVLRGGLLDASIYLSAPYTVDNKAKLVPFAYNITDKRLLVLFNKKVVIFNNGVREEEVIIEDENLYFDNLDIVKYTQNEDVIIFTEPSKPVKELRRSDEGWELALFPVENIPFHAFGGEKKTEKTVSITPNEIEGSITITATSNVFTAESVGQQIDGNGGRMRITGYENEKKVSGYTIIPFLNKDAITKWTYIDGYEVVWSETRGYPVACLFYQQRLFFGGSDQRPATIWSSRVGIYNDFNNVGNYDNDGINIDLNTTNQIVNLLSNRGLQIFTSGDEWIVSEKSLTPNDFAPVRSTSKGSDIKLTPKVLNGTTLFIEKNGKSLLSYLYDYNQANYSASNIGILSSLVADPVAMDINDVSQESEGDYLYIVLGDGTMLVNCIDVEQEVNATSIFRTSGSILGVCSVVNDVYLLVLRGGRIILEKLNDSSYSDSERSVNISGQEIGGLDAFNGYNIDVYSGVDRVANVAVENGVAKLPIELNGEYKIGLAFSSKVLSNNIVVNEKSAIIKKRISKAVLTCTEESKRIKFCGSTKVSSDGIFDFFSVSGYERSLKFTVESDFDRVNILSIFLNINYGV